MMSTPMIIFLVIAAGYIVGAIKVKGFNLGSSGVLIMALIFGHFGFKIPSEIQEIGLLLFVASIGLIAGADFFRSIRISSIGYLFIGFVTIIVGAIVCASVILFFDVPKSLAIGIMTGALTSTPGLAAAVEATGESIASIGYGIAYPFGVIGVVIFVQLIPRLVKDKKTGDKKDRQDRLQNQEKTARKLINIEKHGLFAMAIAIISGIIIGSISIPLPGGGSFSLGNSGGPLLSGLLISHFGHIGKINIRADEKTLEIMRELGMILFLTGAGLNAGNGFVEILRENGISLLFFGALVTAIPMMVSYIISRKLLKMEVMQSLGAICGGMTSTPALGTLLNSSEKSDAVTGAYAMTYPVALVCIILSCQIIAALF